MCITKKDFDLAVGPLSAKSQKFPACTIVIE